MKKLLGIVVLGLLVCSNVNASIIEIGKCISTNYNVLADEYNLQWSSKTHQKYNTFYYKFFDKPKKENWGWKTHDKTMGDAEFIDEEDIKYYESNNYTKIKYREKLLYSINTSNQTVTFLTVYTDDFLEFNRKKIRALLKIKKDKSKDWTEIDEGNLEWSRKIIKTEIEKFQIADYVGGILIAHSVKDLHYSPESRLGIKIDLNTSTVVKNSMDRIHEQFQPFGFLCTSDTSSSGGEGSSGTAFFISNKGHLLTNNHVVEGCKVSKIIYNNKEYDTSLISTDKTLDLALLKTKVKPKSYISFSSKEPKKRQQIIIAGYPLGQGLSDDLKINDGRISALKGFENNSNEITVDVPINPGNSGGPIINQKGQLVAIAVSGMSKDVTEGINFGIKASAAKNFLKSNKISPSAGYLNFSMDDDKIVELLEESTVYTFCN